MKSPAFGLFSAWSGFIFILLLTISWVFFLRIIPFPHAPTMNAEEISSLFLERQLSIGIGAVLMMFSCFFLSLFGSLIVKLMVKLEGGFDLFSINTVIGIGAAIVITFITALLWGVAAFRLEATPETVLLLNDLAWLNFFSTAPAFFVVFIAVAWGALARGNRDIDIFPRWYGYLSLWVFIALVPGALCLLVKTGPFAWNGLIVFWFAVLVFTLFFMISPKVLVPAVRKYF